MGDCRGKKVRKINENIRKKEKESGIIYNGIIYYGIIYGGNYCGSRENVHPVYTIIRTLLVRTITPSVCTTTL